jgi:hypothetical protein
MENQAIDTFGSICLGLTAVVCFFLVLYMSAYQSERLLPIYRDDPIEISAMIRLTDSIPYFNKLIGVLEKLLDKQAELPVTMPLQPQPQSQPRPIKIYMSVNAKPLSPRKNVEISESFFLADL